MKDRILKIRKDSKMTQDAFAEKLGLSKNFVWMLEKGERIPSERTLSDICSKIKIDGESINPEWLRTGVGQPTIKRTRNQEIQNFANEVMEEIDESFRKRFVRALSKLDESDWETLEKIVSDLNMGD